jgi:hypothetical protein
MAERRNIAKESWNIIRIDEGKEMNESSKMQTG